MSFMVSFKSKQDFPFSTCLALLCCGGGDAADIHVTSSLLLMIGITDQISQVMICSGEGYTNCISMKVIPALEQGVK